MVEESYTYAGLLDDVLARCESAYEADDKYFQKILLKASGLKSESFRIPILVLV